MHQSGEPDHELMVLMTHTSCVSSAMVVAALHPKLDVTAEDALEKPHGQPHHDITALSMRQTQICQDPTTGLFSMYKEVKADAMEMVTHCPMRSGGPIKIPAKRMPEDEIVFKCIVAKHGRPPCARLGAIFFT